MSTSEGQVSAQQPDFLPGVPGAGEEEGQDEEEQQVTPELWPELQDAEEEDIQFQEEQQVRPARN